MELFSFQCEISGELQTVSVTRSGELFVVSSQSSILVHLRRVAGECLVYGRMASKLSADEIEVVCSEIKKRVCLLS